MTAGDTLPPQRQPVVLYSWSGLPLAVSDGATIPAGTPGILAMGTDALGVAHRLLTDNTGKLLISVAGLDVFVHNEVPGGVVGGGNVLFTTFYRFKTGTTHLYLNGVRQTEGPGKDYVEDLARTSVTFAVAPLAGSALLIDYVRD